MKALLSPKPRRRDRRAGHRAEHLRRVLRQPNAPADGSRTPDDKRRAFRRMLARYDRPQNARWLRVGLLVAMIALAGLSLRAVSRSGDLVPYAEARADYAALVVAVEAACGGEPCRFGWGAPREMPLNVRAAMARVHARHVEHDPSLGHIAVSSSYRGRSELRYQAPPAPRQARARQFVELTDARWAAEDGGAAPAPLGDGWLRSSSR